MTNPFLDLVRERVVVYDGATGTWLQTQHLTADDFGGPDLEGCTDYLGITRPDVVKALHSAYFEVGADVVETNTFGAFAIPLGEYDMAERSHEIAKANALLAREVADDFSTPDRKRFVAGSIGPGTKFASLGQIRFADLRDAYEVEANGLPSSAPAGRWPRWAARYRSRVRSPSSSPAACCRAPRSVPRWPPSTP